MNDKLVVPLQLHPVEIVAAEHILGAVVEAVVGNTPAEAAVLDKTAVEQHVEPEEVDCWRSFDFQRRFHQEWGLNPDQHDVDVGKRIHVECNPWVVAVVVDSLHT